MENDNITPAGNKRHFDEIYVMSLKTFFLIPMKLLLHLHSRTYHCFRFSAAPPTGALISNRKIFFSKRHR